MTPKQNAVKSKNENNEPLAPIISGECFKNERIPEIEISRKPK